MQYNQIDWKPLESIHKEFNNLEGFPIGGVVPSVAHGLFSSCECTAGLCALLCCRLLPLCCCCCCSNYGIDYENRVSAGMSPEPMALVVEGGLRLTESLTNIVTLGCFQCVKQNKPCDACLKGRSIAPISLPPQAESMR